MSRERRTRKLTVRFTPTEYKKLGDKFKNTVSAELSHNIRNLLFEKPIIIKYRNESFDSFMEEVISLKTELNAIGNNFNQAVKKLHVLKQIPELRNWIVTNEMNCQQILQAAKFIEERIEKIAGRWLQE